MQCDFLLPQSATPWKSPKLLSPYADVSIHANSRDAKNSPSGEIASDNPDVPSLNMLDLELLHNFCTSTCYTFHSDPALKTLWRINVPHLAFSCDFVMRAILALSALHLAYFKPEKRDFYLSQAMIQHRIGLRKATSVLPHVTDENCTALYLFTAATCIFTLASPRKPGDFLVIGDSGIAEWLILFRGTRSIIETSYEALRTGIMGPMFIIGARRNQPQEDLFHEHSAEGEQLNELQQLIRGTAVNEQVLQIYSTAIEDLRKSLFLAYGNGPQAFESSDVFIWLFRVSEDYLMLLRERTQEALAIFAYFCVIPKKLEANWWIEGWSTHLMTRIYNLLDEEHRLWIRWPIEEIGWIPN